MLQTIVEAEADSERVLRAIAMSRLSDESSNERSIQIEFPVAAVIPELLSSIDVLLIGYWKRWRPLLALFENTVRTKVGSYLICIWLIFMMAFKNS